MNLFVLSTSATGCLLDLLGIQDSAYIDCYCLHYRSGIRVRSQRRFRVSGCVLRHQCLTGHLTTVVSTTAMVILTGSTHLRMPIRILVEAATVHKEEDRRCSLPTPTEPFWRFSTKRTPTGAAALTSTSSGGCCRKAEWPSPRALCD